jgi:hypothetical protein
LVQDYLSEMNSNTTPLTLYILGQARDSRKAKFFLSAADRGS